MNDCRETFHVEAIDEEEVKADLGKLNGAISLSNMIAVRLQKVGISVKLNDINGRTVTIKERPELIDLTRGRLKRVGLKIVGEEISEAA